MTRHTHTAGKTRRHKTRHHLASALLIPTIAACSSVLVACGTGGDTPDAEGQAGNPQQAYTHAAPSIPKAPDEQRIPGQDAAGQNNTKQPGDTVQNLDSQNPDSQNPNLDRDSDISVFTNSRPPRPTSKDDGKKDKTKAPTPITEIALSNGQYAKIFDDPHAALKYNGMTMRVRDPQFIPAKPGRLPHVRLTVDITTELDEIQITDSAFVVRLDTATYMENNPPVPQTHTVRKGQTLTLDVQAVALEEGTYMLIVNDDVTSATPVGWQLRFPEARTRR